MQLADTSNPNTARIDFTPNAAATVTFNLNISENYTGPGPGDFFGLNLLLSGNPLSSNDPGGTNLFLSTPIGQFGATFTTFTDGRGIDLTVGSPFPENTAVPEPSSLAMLALGLAAIATRRKF
ncbi:MAG: PEP-CTERM sorting domain-containing protein [Bryobacterales bacterium]|nr:PEP-CTERM sorting domain-containing protein [Bryobacterales bacterium]